MKLNSTTANGFGIKSIAGYGPSAWKIGSAPVTIPSRACRNRKATARSQREARSGNAGQSVAVSALVTRRYAGTESRVWGVLDLAVGFLLIVCPIMMSF
jgi:hypothetical protein